MEKQYSHLLQYQQQEYQQTYKHHLHLHHLKTKIQRHHFHHFPPTTIEDLFALSSPSTIISILLCLVCTIISSVSIFLVTICWFFLIKYKLRYKAVKKELVRQKTTQDVLAKTNAVHSNQYPELVFEEFTDKSVIRPQMEVSANQMQAKPPLPNNHPPSNSYYTQERIYEAIPTQQKRHSKSSSIYEVDRTE